MQNKQNTKAKVIVVAIAILLCLALAVGITGAFYQAQRRATGTVKMDKGIVIDYKGFGKTPNEGTWLRETTISFKLFEDADVQPGEKISLNDAGIKANASSVDFYARVKLSYEFYNGETKLETLPASFKVSDLITTSATFFGSDWVDSGAGDGYYYYATGTTLNKFTKATPAGFVDLFDTNARFIIEGAGFTGAYPDGEGGGFRIDESTSINKIVVYLTLETLQGDVSAEELNTMGWKINVSSMVDFSKIEGEDARIETSVGKLETTENLNVSVDEAEEVPLNKVVFPYDTTTTLTFDSNNVEYVTLTHSNGESETFNAATYEVAENTFQVYADSSKGTVTAYTIGLFNDKEYSGFTFSTQDMYRNLESGELNYYDVVDGVALSNYFGTETNITIPSSVRVKNRDFKVVVEGYSNYDDFHDLFYIAQSSIKYPCTLNNTQTLNNENDLYNILENAGANDSRTFDQFMEAYPKMEFKFETLCATNSIIYAQKTIKVIGYGAFDFCNNLETITLPDSIISIGQQAFLGCGLTSITIPKSVIEFREASFAGCENLETIEVSAENTKYHSEGNCLIETASKTLIVGCKNSIIPTDGSVTSIGDYAFYAHTGLTSITIPDSVTSIGNDAFRNCSGLTSITIPSGVTSIEDFTFYRCSNLISITIPSGVTSIGYNAFANCTGLTTITIPDSVTSIGGNAFDYCNNLQASITEGGISYLGNATNKYIVAWKVADNTLSSYTIKDGCKFIYHDCFFSCSSATEITIPNSVTSIGYFTFYDCSSLTSITIPNSVTSILGSAFRNCNNLETTIGDGWVKVEDGSAVDSSTLLKDIDYDIRRNA